MFGQEYFYLVDTTSTVMTTPERLANPAFIPHNILYFSGYRHEVSDFLHSHPEYHGKSSIIKKIFTTKFGLNDKLYLMSPLDVTYGYLKGIDSDGTLVVFFPQKKVSGSGWKERDFSTCPVTALKERKLTAKQARG